MYELNEIYILKLKGNTIPLTKDQKSKKGEKCRLERNPFFIFYYFSLNFFFPILENLLQKRKLFIRKSRIITTFGHQIPGKDVKNTGSVQLNPDEQGLAKSGSGNISAFAINNSENNLEKSEIFFKIKFLIACECSDLHR